MVYTYPFGFCFCNFFLADFSHVTHCFTAIFLNLLRYSMGAHMICHVYMYMYPMYGGYLHTLHAHTHTHTHPHTHIY